MIDENFQKAVKGVYQCKTQNLDNWTSNDPTVPVGWRIRKFNFGTSIQVRLLSPEGKMFQGRRAALKYMIDQKYPKENIEEIRDSLKYDGWLSDLKLPEKWLYKKASKEHASYTFVSAKGYYYQSREFVKASKDVLEEDKVKIENFRKAAKGVYQCKTQNLDIWTSNDASVPKGWRMRKLSLGKVGQVRLLSPDGKMFQARRAALKYMIDEQYSGENR